MKHFDNIRDLLYSLFYKHNNKDRKLQRIFQWSRYFDWKDLTPEEKLSAKRLLFLPVLAYLILTFFNENFLMIVLLIFGYMLYKKFESTNITKR